MLRRNIIGNAIVGHRGVIFVAQESNIGDPDLTPKAIDGAWYITYVMAYFAVARRHVWTP